MKLKQVAAAALAGVCLVGVGFWFGSASASTAEPGSVADPLVSKSYIDQLVARLAKQSYVDERLNQMATKSYVESQFATKQYVNQRFQQTVSRAEVEQKTLFQVVELGKGAMLLGGSGTEIVLRGGQATIVTTPKGGVLDATAGVDLPQGAQVTPNHLLVIPVGDGRGLIAQTDVILIVKGTYAVQPAGQ